MISPAVAEPELEMPLDPIDELRAQYVACSYLATACQEALGRFPPPAHEGEGGHVAQRALEFLLAVEWDWRQTLSELADKVGKATSVAGAEAVTRHLKPVPYTHAEDTAAPGEGAPRHRTDRRRRPSVGRRL
ncbi:MAG TPA: hypothetical protein VMT90_04110 [Dehalococcoidia bacterium]|nr:hypothetical protein [Dehalococcoidia bacterium]